MGEVITSRFGISALSPELPYLLHPCSRQSERIPTVDDLGEYKPNLSLKQGSHSMPIAYCLVMVLGKLCSSCAGVKNF